MNDRTERSGKKSFYDHITGAKDGRLTDGTLPDGRPQAKAVDTTNQALKDRHERRQAEDVPLKDAVAAHPVGVAAGAAAGFAAGAVGGLAAGPVGSLFGALAGAVLGGAAGSGAHAGAGAPVDDPAWRHHHGTLAGAAPYDEYANAYRLGSAARRHYGDGRRFDELDAEMAADWPRLRGTSRLSWDEARDAARWAWTEPARKP